MLRGLFILPLFLLLYFTGNSQTWRVDKLGVSDGLSQGYIYVIHQDRKGFVWIGTHGGLNRYDGYGFKTFQYKPFNAATLGDNAVFFLKEDSVTGRFWIGGSSCLNEFDPESFNNKRYYYEKKQLEFSDGVFINAHQLLLACEYAVLIFDTRSKTFTEIPVLDENNQVITVSRVENVCPDRAGHAMIMSRTGIFFYDPITKTCKRKTASSPDLSAFNSFEVFNVIQDKRNHYWIATNKKGLIRFDPLSKKSNTVVPGVTAKNERLRFDVVLEDHLGDIWAGSSGGLFRVNPRTLAITHLTATPGDGGSLSHPEVNAITEDKNNFLWIGTVGGGINKLIPQNAGFKNFDITKNSGNQAGTYIMAIQQAGDDIWFTNIWDQVGRVNMKTGSASLLDLRALPVTYSWYSEGAIVKTAADEITVLNGEQQYRISNASGRVSIKATASPGLTYVFRQAGVTLYMVKAAVEKPFFRNDTIYGNNFFYDAVADVSGYIWMGTSKGLMRFNTRDQSFSQFQHNDNDSTSISSDFIYALEIDKNFETLWMAAYNGGLCSYHIPSGKFRHFSKEDGLADNIVYAIEKDQHDNYWFSSNAGISVYNHLTKTFRNFGVADGLLNHEFNRKSSFKNEAGFIFFGGISGIDYFHPDSIVKNNVTANLAFTGFRIFDNEYVPGYNNNMPTVEVKHNQRYITIEFAALDYSDQQKVQYAYRINGDEWITTGTQHSLSFSDLPTGRHRLFIRSTNNEGTWLNNEISCLIVVSPPWWQTWWFRASGTLLAIGLSLLVIRIYYRRKLERQRAVLERQQAIEKERTRIATDMHDDLGAGLSRIKFLSETIAIKKLKQEPIETDISSIRHYSHEMIDKMGEIVWALNEKNDSLIDLLAYTRAYIMEYLSQNGIQAMVETDENITDAFVSGEFRRNIYLAVKEALHNIVKHAQATRVTITIERNVSLAIRIHDNGTGFDPRSVRPFSNGLSNMKKRMESLGGSIAVESSGGTLVTLKVPLP